MRSGTLFFDSTLIWKNFKRFWLIWSGYILLMVFLLPMSSRMLHFSQGIFYLSERGMLLLAVFAPVCAAAAFHRLYFRRGGSAPQALPTSSAGMFLTNYLSGLCTLLFPGLFVVLSTLTLTGVFGAMNGRPLMIWLLVQSGCGLFFYSLAVLCAVLSRHILILPVLYGSFNFLVYGVTLLYQRIMAMSLFGFYCLPDAVWKVIQWLTPLVRLRTALGVHSVEQEHRDFTRNLALDQPEVAAIYAAAGAALALLAMLLYCRRLKELSGRPNSRALFRLGVGTCAGLAIATVLVFVGSSLDWLDLENRVPALDDIRSMEVQLQNDAPRDSCDLQFLLAPSTPQKTAQMEKFLTLHQAIVNEKHREDLVGDDHISYTVQYHLNSGLTFSRRYSMPVFEQELDDYGSVTQAANDILQDRALVYEGYAFNRFNSGERRLTLVCVDNVPTYSQERDIWEGKTVYPNGAPEEELMLLWQAVLDDFAEGTIGVRYLIGNSAQRQNNTSPSNLVFTWRCNLDLGDISYFDICLTPNASHTLKMLEELGFDMEQLLTHSEYSALVHP